MSVQAPERPAAKPGPPRPGNGSTLAHRVILTARGRASFDAARSATADWVARKHGTAPLATGIHALNDTATLTNQVIYGPTGQETALRLQLREQTPEATWRTTVTATDTGRNVIASIALEVFPAPGHRPSPGWPILIRTLTGAIKPIDGKAHLTCQAQSIGRYDVPLLAEILTDPHRRLPAIVAARPASPDPVWSQRMSRLMPQCAGAASLFLLTDAEAVDALRFAVGGAHRVTPGSVRTFLPGVDIHDFQSASRHRFIPLPRLADPADTAWRAVAGSVQRGATAALVPFELRALTFPEPESAHRERRHAALAALRDTLEVDQLKRDVAELRALLEVADQDLQSAAADQVLAEAVIAGLEAELADTRTRADAADEDAVWALAEAERAGGEALELRGRLHAAGRHDEATLAPPEAVSAPASFAELLERAAGLPGVLVTADRSITLPLDEHERARVWSAKTWQGLRALSAYAEATKNGDTDGFYEYCRSGRGTVGYSANQVVVSESGKTMEQWGHERVFPVPVELDPTGASVMQAHLRIEVRGATSPRVYFLDDTKGVTGCVIVGYVGPHLTNTRTN